jgi:transcriptional regulator with XRE-family HTH domain
MISLKDLREAANLSQVEVGYKANISSSRLSLFENGQGSLTAEEQERARVSIVRMAKERAKHVSESSRIVQLRESTSRAAGRGEGAGAYKTEDRRLALAMKTIESRASSRKLFATVRESRRCSDLEAAVFTLGRNYPK